ncbi:sensor histidine kinase [Catelliglobosispora koreensis]|uniref:sensor histidine kinase n=1 Tax=Catelliglobosispora koreensis TaxID=129052 RepID=UPI00036763B7|nr:histidine kinase [Catelliglobosispora koreensis]
MGRWYSWAQDRPLLIDALLAIGVAAVFLPMSLVTIALDAPRPWRIALVISAVVAHASIGGRRRWPFASFVLMSVALLVQTMAPIATYRFETAFLPCAALFPVGLYSLCAYGNRWLARVGIGIGLAGAVMLTIRAAKVWPVDSPASPGFGTPLAWVFFLGFMMTVVFAAWGTARLRRLRMDFYEVLEAEQQERAQRAIADDRARIAREMHDVVAHSLSVMVTQAQGGELIAAADPARAGKVLGTIAATGRQALADMRGLVGVLRTDTDGLAPPPTLAELPALIERVRGAGLHVSRSDRGKPRELGPAAELALYRLVQEALTNTLRHAGPGARARLSFDWGDQAVKVQVHDTGKTLATTTSGKGAGLAGMRERLAIVGGSVIAGPAAGGGFAVEATVPLEERE